MIIAVEHGGTEAYLQIYDEGNNPQIKEPISLTGKLPNFKDPEKKWDKPLPIQRI